MTIDISGFLTKVKAEAEIQQEMMARNGFVIDNLDDRWQKLVFTLYSHMVALSSEAGQILEEIQEMPELQG